jgi:hypothetical protein
VLLLDPRVAAANTRSLPKIGQSLACAHAVRIGRTRFMASVVPVALCRWTPFGAMPGRAPAMWSR